MRNAKTELLGAIPNGLIIKCAEIELDDNYGTNVRRFDLKVGYSPEEYNKFLNELDFEYDSGFGGQELFGTVWLSNSTWLSRGEYDGSEWWEHNELPAIPERLL